MVINLDPTILWTLLGVLTLIVVKTFLTWIIAWRDEEFDIREAPRFVVTQVLPYMAGLLVLALPSIWHPDLLAIYLAGAAVVALKYLAEIKDRFQTLFGVSLDRPEGQGIATKVDSATLPDVKGISEELQRHLDNKVPL